MTIKIFLSVGRTSTPEQEAFVGEIEAYLQANGLTPQTVGRTYFTSEQPLKAVSGLLQECAGTVILAFERVYIEAGAEKRGSPAQKPIQESKLPTVWNQIEAAMAYTLGHPLLVIVENGLRSEGLLEMGYDWYVQWVDLRREALFDREFTGVFADWKRRVEARAARQGSAAPAPDKEASAGVQPAQAYPQVQAPPAQPVTKPAQDAEQPLRVNASPVDLIKILFLTANPSDTNRLRLDEESRAIDQSLRQAEFRDRFNFNQYQATRVTDLQSCLLRYEPHIVHFSGHGSGVGELVLLDNTGHGQPVPARALSVLFSVLKDNIRCVVLNACYSEEQAAAIAEHIDCVVGMSNAIGDESAISFSTAFYQALAYGRDVQTAFDLGCLQIDLENLAEQDIPKLLSKKGDPRKISFVVKSRP